MAKIEKKDAGVVIAYLRISTETQELNTQKLELYEYARKNDLKIDEFVEAEVSSRKPKALRKIDLLLEKLNAGDLLLISELSRLARSVGQIARIVDVLIKKQVRLISVKENIKIDGAQDIQTKVMTTMFSLFAEIERDLISERTKQGLAAARAKGKILGRPRGRGKSKLDEFQSEIKSLLQNGSTKTFIAQKYGTTTANLYRWMNRLDVPQKFFGVKKS